MIAQTGALKLKAAVPNPATNQASVEFETSEAGIVQISLIDGEGRVVRRPENESLTAGSYVRELSLNDLAAGMYWLELRAAGEVMREALVVVR